MTAKIEKQFPLSFHWETQDPFLFLAHHRDLYPKGNPQMGPVASLEGRRMGNDFDLKNDFKMYHGHTVPGFPEHPHRGFETVTIVLEGYVDHFDSFGASGRYGEGDTQWMTAGKGMQHCEMFPCVHQEAPNPLELFQVWLNLPQAQKFVEPYYQMLWGEDVPFNPIVQSDKEVGHCKLISGKLFDQKRLCPAPDSYARQEASEVTIALMTVVPNERLVLTAVPVGVKRTLYYYSGEGCTVEGANFAPMTGLMVDHGEITLKNKGVTSKYLLLQGKPLLEPVVAYGPFVMNSRAEIAKAYDDYHETRFGGWPWQRPDPVHELTVGRIAKYPDGTIEKP